MLQMLRAMNRWELAEVCRAAGVPEGSRPEEIVRSLSGAWWAAPWGALEEERLLLLRAAEALNLMPRLIRHRGRLGVVERMVYGALVQQAFVTAPEERQNALLSAAELNLEPDRSALTVLQSVEFAAYDRRQLTIQRLLCSGAGLRAVTAALTEVPVEPPPYEGRPGPGALLTALASAGAEGWSGRVVEWVRARRGPDLTALFHVMRLCWLQRQRLLLELRASMVGLQEEEKRLSARLEAVASERAAARRARPWHRRPSTGMGIAVGGLVGAAAERVIAGDVHLAAAVAAGTGCLWSLTTLASARSVGSGAARRALRDALQRARRQRALLEGQISQLEE
jgi:hypothetical protein